jgi:hypothetical protein
MIKGKTLIRSGVYFILISLLIFGILLFWPARTPSESEIAKRGSVAPPEPDFSIIDSQTWRTSYGSPRDWIDQGMDSLMSWDLNPWKVEDQWFGQHLEILRKSKNPNDQAEFDRLRKLGREWHQRIAARYPELANLYRDVPDDRNALKKLADLEKRFRSAEDPNIYLVADFPKDLKEQLSNRKPWDTQAAKAWLDANQSLLDEIHSIGLMTDSSTKGFADFNPYRLTGSFTNMLLLEARVAADHGDVQGALESIQAANGLAGHLSGADAPTLVMTLHGYSLQRTIRETVFGSILPDLQPSQVDLTTLENGLNPKIESPETWAKTIRAEWNVGMGEFLLPSLADTADLKAPRDPDLLAEAYTRQVLEIVRNNENRTLTELPGHPDPKLDFNHLSLKSRSIMSMVEVSYARKYWEMAQIHAGLTQAAFAILRGQPVPNDPIHGKPYMWDPNTRLLSLPAGAPFNQNNKFRPLVLPKL